MDKIQELDYRIGKLRHVIRDIWLVASNKDVYPITALRQICEKAEQSLNEDDTLAYTGSDDG